MAVKTPKPFGMTTQPQAGVKALHVTWFEALDDATRKQLCDDMQRLAMDELPSIPLGCFYSNTALRRDMADRIPGLSIFWNIRRA